MTATRSFQALPTHVVALAKAAFLAARPCYGYAFSLVRGDHPQRCRVDLPSFLSKQPSYSHLSCWGNKNWGNIFSNWVLGMSLKRSFFGFHFFFSFRNDGQAMVLWWPGATRAPVAVPPGKTQGPDPSAGCGRWRLRHWPSRQCWRTGGTRAFRPTLWHGRLMTKMLAQQEKNHFLIDGNG